jgi:hypothetical protein
MNIKRSKFFIIFVCFFIIVISNQITFYYLSSSEYSFMNTKKKSENSNFSNLLNPSNSETEKGNYSIIQMLSISDSGGIIEPGSYYRYPSFIGNNLSINFILIDLNFSKTSILDPTNQATFLIKYNKTSGEGEEGILANNLKFDNDSKAYHGIIETYILTNEGKYTFEINMSLLDYEIQLFSFNFFLGKKFEVDLFVSKPNQIVAGEKFTIQIYASYIDDFISYPLIGASINAIFYINNQTFIKTKIRKTNTQGRVGFEIILPLYTNEVTFDVEMVEEYNHIGKELYDIDINVIPIQEFLINSIFSVILIAFVLIVLIFSYYKLIIPKKNKKKLILNEYKQFFKDILKLENLYILHKSSGEFLFYKTYTSEKINSEILNDIKSFISSLNDSMKSQSVLKEINYKSKILLLIDGNYVIIGAILNKEGSDVFKNNLKECIVYFEDLYKNELSNKYVKLNLFVELEKIIEDKLNISIILPHRIEYNIDKRLLKAPHSKDLYHLLNNLIKESGNKSFYLSDILIEFSKQNGKGFIEFFICIKEFKDNNLLTSINKIYPK